MKRHELAEITERTPSGLSLKFRCACGREHLIGSYVFAHWHDRINHTCEDCGRVNLLRSGVVKTPTKDPRLDALGRWERDYRAYDAAHPPRSLLPGGEKISKRHMRNQNERKR